MLSLELNASAVKSFMGQLLRDGIFSEFDMRTAELLTQIRITIDGGTETGYASWESIRSLVYTIIKEGAKPRYIKIIFSLNVEQSAQIHPNAAALFLNLVYENDTVTFTTASAQKEFALDKTLDIAWDEWMSAFFAKKNLPVAKRE